MYMQYICIKIYVILYWKLIIRIFISITKIKTTLLTVNILINRYISKRLVNKWKKQKQAVSNITNSGKKMFIDVFIIIF